MPSIIPLRKYFLWQSSLAFQYHGSDISTAVIDPDDGIVGHNFKSVDLPAPFPPIIPTTSPLFASKSTSFKA